MNDVLNITNTVRYLIEDFSRPQVPGDIFIYANSNTFTLSELNVISIIRVLRNNTILSPLEYDFEASTCRLTLNTSSSVGDIIEVQYNYYCGYSNTELAHYARAAVTYLSVNNYYTFTVDDNGNFYPDITDNEVHLIAFVASILIKPENKTLRLPDMTINVPNSMPTRDLVKKAITIFKHSTTGVYTII